MQDMEEPDLNTIEDTIFLPDPDARDESGQEEPEEPDKPEIPDTPVKEEGDPLFVSEALSSFFEELNSTLTEISESTGTDDTEQTTLPVPDTTTTKTDLDPRLKQEHTEVDKDTYGEEDNRDIDDPEPDKPDVPDEPEEDTTGQAGPNQIGQDVEDVVQSVIDTILDPAGIIPTPNPDTDDEDTTGQTPDIPDSSIRQDKAIEFDVPFFEVEQTYFLPEKLLQSEST